MSNDYCISKCKVTKILSYSVRVPTPEKGKYTYKRFSTATHTNPKAAAILYRDKMGRAMWGEDLWDRILASGSVTSFRSKLKGVCVYKSMSDGQYPMWTVSWREPENISSTTRSFGAKSSGSLAQAEVAAHAYACSKRAELLNQEPIRYFEFEFDLIER